MKIQERQEAVNEGLKKYYTGRPCARGHRTFRYTATGVCRDCSNQNSIAWQKKYRAQIAAAKVGHRILTIEIDIRDALVIEDFVSALAIARKFDKNSC